jgi:hypothetical protein
VKNFCCAKKILIMACFFWGSLYGADILWSPASMYTIPDDGNIYYIDFAKATTADLTVSGNKIRCIDSTNTITLDNVVWVQDGDYTFTQGKFYVSGDWTIKGDDTVFTYSSSQESTIASNALIRVQDAMFRVVL